ncbi:uncharacterized protein LOC101854085 [Aplysia californica]|uniref:Uncharacterized protein LOC101854085 n=1 Tax=Aplysia californica TaxID=6500 RepID=A0ABM0JPV3_APLCA|nr:uncharacterized protein LOC101854085 [Aplysia californica]
MSFTLSDPTTSNKMWAPSGGVVCLAFLLTITAVYGAVVSTGSLQQDVPTRVRLYKRSVEAVPIRTNEAGFRYLPPGVATDTIEWLDPPFRPLSLTSQVTNDAISVTFQVKHVTSGIVTKPLATVQPREITVRHLPAGEGTSNVTFTIDASYCKSNRESATFWFEGNGRNENNLLSVKVLVCNFELTPEFRISQINPEEGQKPKKFVDDVRSADVSLVQVSLENRIEIVETGQNMTIPIIVRHNGESLFFITPVFYDSLTDTFTAIEFIIRRGWPIDTFEVNDSASGYFTMREVQLPQADQESGGDPTSADVRRLDLTLATSSGHFTGMVHVSGLSSGGPSYPRPGLLMTSTYSDVPILVKRRDQEYPVPTGKYLFRQVRSVTCASRGSHRSPGSDDISDCTVTCWVNGRDISSLRIYREGSEGRGESTSVSQVYQYHAEAFLNLGPTQRSLVGNYVCEVQGQNGSTASMTIVVRVNMND